MCGIVGFIGRKQACPVLIEGLDKLSYRGYDSAGIAVLNESNSICVRKAQGKVERLKQLLKTAPAEGNCGIGHTRWATHGKPSDINAHPHTDSEGKIAVVHNGMIENQDELRKELEAEGTVFVSDTDTEVIAHMLRKLYDGDMISTLVKAMRILNGSYALGVLDAAHPDRIFFVRCGSPLIVACRNGEGMIASDVSAMLDFSRDVVFVEEQQIGVLSQQGIILYDENGHPIPFTASHVPWEQSHAEKDGFDHFMLKEIHDQPDALRNAAAGRNQPENTDWFPLSSEEIVKLEKVTIIACGTAYHAGVLGSYAIERLAGISSRAEPASEYRYRMPVVCKNELVIAVSQSGETADTLAAAREAVRNGAKLIALCNVVGSALAREAGVKNTLYTCAGPEIAVASTKAYVTQAEVLILIAAVLARVRQKLSGERALILYQKLAHMPENALHALKLKEKIRQLAKRMMDQEYILFVGRCADYALSMEAALKLKEVSYIFSQAYPAGELKHGPIALLKPGQLVMAAITQEHVVDKMIANLQEIRARGAQIATVCTEKLAEKVSPHTDEIIVIPNTDEGFAPILAAIPMQLFAYYMAIEKGCDVDQPRNLAKSVTVE